MKKQGHMTKIVLSLLVCIGSIAVILFMSGYAAAAADEVPDVTSEFNVIAEPDQYGICAAFDGDSILVTDGEKFHGDPMFQLARIPAEYGDYSLMLTMTDETHGSILYCSSPAGGQMMKRLFVTADRWKTYDEIDISSQLDAYPNSFVMKTEEIGYIGVALRNTAYLYKTTDGGATWNPTEIMAGVDVRDGYAPVWEGETGYLILEEWVEDTTHCVLYRTTDGGVSWERTSRFDLDGTIQGYFVSDGFLCVADTQERLHLYELPAES